MKQSSAASSTPEIARYRRLVDQVEQLALADSGEPLHIAALCRVVRVSQRTLCKAFQQIHGLPTCRYFRMLRLAQARQALLSASCASTTVTEIAADFGFVELGRFSVEYRKVFGESPSQTLHRTSLTQACVAANSAIGVDKSVGAAPSRLIGRSSIGTSASSM